MLAAISSNAPNDNQAQQHDGKIINKRTVTPSTIAFIGICQSLTIDDRVIIG